ncbi:MAG: hypothetical protein NC110_06555 [Ruminococcus sp.]|nr:hypothetical protein [Ruminococcus sp.]
MKEQYKAQVSKLRTSESFEENTIALLQKEAGKDKTMLKNKPVRIILAAALAIVLLAGTAFAVSLITSSDVALLHNDNALAEAFNSKDAKVINKTITTDEYTITLLGMVSGKKLCDWQVESNFDTEKTYIAVMASYNDGRKMETDLSEGSQNTLGPLKFAVAFDGVAPWMFNSDWFPVYVDGIGYYLIDSANLEPFADKNVKLFAYDKHSFPTGEVFSFDNETGKLSYNESYDGVQAVFDLPLDKSKASEEEAQRVLSEWHLI